MPDPTPEILPPTVDPSTTPEAAPRTITVVFKKSMVQGRVLTPNGPPACIAGVQVDIQRASGSEWKTLRTTTTSATGGYRQKLPNVGGKFRATTPEVVVDGQTFPEVSSKASNYHPE